jgi:hypothetical protein
VASVLLPFPPIHYMHPSSPHSCYMPRPSHPSRLYYCNYICRRVQTTKLHLMQFSSLFAPNILLSTLFSSILSLCSSLNIREKYHTHTQPQAKL